ncbi:MAG: hypothetical protein IJQ81_09505 [Oscillibacter sp.]|nr:hypothetical protein [Oscillibacter sp.]
MESIVYLDAKIGVENHKILDIGALRDGETFHSASAADFWAFAADADYLCGHNIVRHDLKYLSPLRPTPSRAAPIVSAVPVAAPVPAPPLSRASERRQVAVRRVIVIQLENIYQ